MLVPQYRRPPVAKDQVEAFKKNIINLCGVPDDAKAVDACLMEAGNAIKMRDQMVIMILSSSTCVVDLQSQRIRLRRSRRTFSTGGESPTTQEDIEAGCVVAWRDDMCDQSSGSCSFTLFF